MIIFRNNANKEIKKIQFYYNNTTPGKKLSKAFTLYLPQTLDNQAKASVLDPNNITRRLYHLEEVTENNYSSKKKMYMKKSLTFLYL